MIRWSSLVWLATLESGGSKRCYLSLIGTGELLAKQVQEIVLGVCGHLFVDFAEQFPAPGFSCYGQ